MSAWFGVLRAAVIVAVVGGLAGLIEVRHAAYSLVAILICLPPTLASLWLTFLLASRHVMGGLMGMALGIVIRILVVMGFGLAYMFAMGLTRYDILAFWLWILFAYLSLLVMETVGLTRSGILGSRQAGTVKG